MFHCTPLSLHLSFSQTACKLLEGRNHILLIFVPPESIVMPGIKQVLILFELNKSSIKDSLMSLDRSRYLIYFSYLKSLCNFIILTGQNYQEGNKSVATFSISFLEDIENTIQIFYRFYLNELCHLLWFIREYLNRLQTIPSVNIDIIHILATTLLN